MSESRASARFEALQTAGERVTRKFTKTYGQIYDRDLKTSEYYGCNTFSFELMEKKLPAADVAQLRRYATSDTPLSLQNQTPNKSKN
ncbi:MAG: hypothetical protein NTV34_20410 [Proteobacteria bacterium]|nr:hypothetical protein [Pseudomonadota bacterium]